MGKFRFSLAALFALVAFAAVGCTALVNASHGWACILFTAAFVACLLAAVIAVARSGSTRSTALGFALGGFTYMVAVFSPLLGKNISAPRILTGEALLALHPHVERPVKPPPPVEVQFSPPVPVFDESSAANRAMPPRKTPTWTDFEQVGHSLFALGFAFVAAVLTRWLYLRRETQA